jgi:hypothetical protein
MGGQKCIQDWLGNMKKGALSKDLGEEGGDIALDHTEIG